MHTIYLDNGVISRIKSKFHPQGGTQIAYSDASLIDLKNSKDPSPELQYLEKVGAIHLTEKEGRVYSSNFTPQERFEQLNPIGNDIMGEIIAFMNGGGPTQTSQEHVINLLSKVKNYVPEIADLLDQLVSNQPITDIDTSNTTNRDVEQMIAKQNFPSLIDEVNPLQRILEAIPEEDQSNFLTIFPRSASNLTYDNFVQASLLLSTVGIGVSKGIKKQGIGRAEKVGSHDYLDAQHIAYGLHTNQFVTTDKATFEKFEALRNYWQIQTYAEYYQP